MKRVSLTIHLSQTFLLTISPAYYIADEIAQTNWDVNTLASKYQAVIDLYQLTRIDLDIEGHASYDSSSVERRSQALAIVTRNNPNLQLSYTLATGTTGLDSTGITIVQSAKNAGVRLFMINLMYVSYEFVFLELLSN